MSESVIPEPPNSEPSAPAVDSDAAVAELIKKLHSQQNFPLAIVAAVVSALVGATLWAVITVSTEYQIGFMAVGVGALVGFSVRILGKGVDQKYGILGAIFALVGCLLGNLFTQVGFAATELDVNFFEILFGLSSEVIVEIYAQSFAPMDLLFYGIAVYEGFKFSFQQLDDSQLSTLKS